MTDLDDPGLFPEPPRTIEPEPEDITAGARIRRRQAIRIARGHHPLGDWLRLHPEASRDPEDRTGPGPRCGGCRFREQVGGHARAYPKCLYGYERGELAPDDFRRRTGATHYVRMPRVTHSETSDVRAWWPGCVNWAEQGPDEPPPTVR